MNRDDGARQFFEKLRIVEKFCGGDTAIAKKIIKGEYTDIIALKGRFKGGEDEFFGLFLVFISRMTQHVIFAQSVISRTASVFHHKPFDTWKSFNAKLEKEINEAEIDTERMGLLDGVLTRLAELKFFPSIFEWVETNDIMNLTDRFQKVVNNVLKTDDCRVVLDFENTTSIVIYEEKGIKPV
jgi:hypothetical protein